LLDHVWRNADASAAGREALAQIVKSATHPYSRARRRFDLWSDRSRLSGCRCRQRKPAATREWVEHGAHGIRERYLVRPASLGPRRREHYGVRRDFGPFDGLYVGASR
jgi:hypothetical protein